MINAEEVRNFLERNRYVLEGPYGHHESPDNFYKILIGEGDEKRWVGSLYYESLANGTGKIRLEGGGKVKIHYEASFGIDRAYEIGAINMTLNQLQIEQALNLRYLLDQNKIPYEEDNGGDIKLKEISRFLREMRETNISELEKLANQINSGK